LIPFCSLSIGSHNNISILLWFRLPVLAGTAGALGATYPYLAVDGASSHQSGQASAMGTSRLAKFCSIRIFSYHIVLTTISFPMFLNPIARGLIYYFLLLSNLCSKDHNVNKANNELKPPQKSGKYFHVPFPLILYQLPLVTNIIIFYSSVCRACK